MGMRLLGIVFVTGLLCCSNTQITHSRGLALPVRIQELGKAIKLKSAILGTEFVLYDANGSGSIPGASSKDYKVFIRLNPGDIHLWTADKQNWITSFPKDHDWLEKLVPDDPAISREFESAGYTTYFKAEGGYEYTLWASEKAGILLLRYIQK
jgi:hypothetical protein